MIIQKKLLQCGAQQVTSSLHECPAVFQKPIWCDVSSSYFKLNYIYLMFLHFVKYTKQLKSFDFKICTSYNTDILFQELRIIYM